MSAIEIVGGVVLLAVSIVIIVLTLMQHTHGQGLSGAINGQRRARGTYATHHAATSTTAARSRIGRHRTRTACRIIG